MNPFSIEALLRYWSEPEVGASVIILMNLLGALVLGSFVGYERSYRSRAAGMRTLGLVCMGSAALTVLCGYPYLWYGAHFATTTFDGTTRVIQGIVTGIGFLGAGVIVKEGSQISGLTTAASIWVVAAIGIMVGVGLYLAAIVLALLSTAFTMWGSKFEIHLPSQTALMVKIRFEPHSQTTENDLKQFFKTYGYIIARNTISIIGQDQGADWNFVVVGQNKRSCATIPTLSGHLENLPGVKRYQMSYARN